MYSLPVFPRCFTFMTFCQRNRRMFEFYGRNTNERIPPWCAWHPFMTYVCATIIRRLVGGLHRESKGSVTGKSMLGSRQTSGHGAVFLGCALLLTVIVPATLSLIHESERWKTSINCWHYILGTVTGHIWAKWKCLYILERRNFLASPRNSVTFSPVQPVC